MVAGRNALWERASQPFRRQAARFPFERGLVMAVAAVVGLYGGIAAGLFATAIPSVQLILFRGPEVAAALFGVMHVEWLHLLAERLAAAHWHLEFAATDALVLVAAAALDALGGKRLPGFEVQRIRSVALAAALGLSHCYLLLFLRTFNGTFTPSEGGLYELL